MRLWHLLLFLVSAGILTTQVTAGDQAGNPDTKTPGEYVNSMNMFLSFDGQGLKANLVECEATAEFVSMLPVPVKMHDYFSRIKYSLFDKPLSLSGPAQIEYEIGYIAYWPEGNELLIYYRYDGKPMRSDIIIMGGIVSAVETLQEYTGSIDITFGLE